MNLRSARNVSASISGSSNGDEDEEVSCGGGDNVIDDGATDSCAATGSTVAAVAEAYKRVSKWWEAAARRALFAKTGVLVEPTRKQTSLYLGLLKSGANSLIGISLLFFSFASQK